LNMRWSLSRFSSLRLCAFARLLFSPKGAKGHWGSWLRAGPAPSCGLRIGDSIKSNRPGRPLMVQEEHEILSLGNSRRGYQQRFDATFPSPRTELLAYCVILTDQAGTR